MRSDEKVKFIEMRHQNIKQIIQNNNMLHTSYELKPTSLQNRWKRTRYKTLKKMVAVGNIPVAGTAILC